MALRFDQNSNVYRRKGVWSRLTKGTSTVTSAKQGQWRQVCRLKIFTGREPTADVTHLMKGQTERQNSPQDTPLKAMKASFVFIMMRNILKEEKWIRSSSVIEYGPKMYKALDSIPTTGKGNEI